MPTRPIPLRQVCFVSAISLLAVALALTGYWMLFSSFAIYDDEGYILISVREYFAQGHLYETVYSQYGPTFYAVLDVIQHLIGGPIDHTGARLLTLTCWLGSAIVCASLTWRHTASRSLTGFTLGSTFLFLYFFNDEPFHPGALIILILSVSLYLTSRLIETACLNLGAVVAGGTAALLLLAKINVGVFYCAAIVAWGAVHAVHTRQSKLVGVVAAIGLILLAALLTHTLWSQPWVQVYLGLFASGVGALFITMSGEPILARRQVALWAVSGMAVGGLILGAVWIRGTSLSGLLEGVVLGPLRHPGNYSFPVAWRPGSVPLAGLSLAFATSLPWLRRRFSAVTIDHLIVGCRLAAGAALVTGVALLMTFRAIGAIFSYLAPLVWIWIVPLRGLTRNPGQEASRSLLGTVLILQYLHAYPVGGIQESWGTFLFMPLVALGLGDVRRWFALPPVAASAPRRTWSGIGAGLVLVTTLKVGWTALRARENYEAQSSLGLSGATRLHLPERQRVAYRILALNAAVHLDTLFSAPGMFSFNLWADVSPPTAKNTTLWFSLLNAGEQQEIISKLGQSPRAGLIVQSSLIDLMRENGFSMQGPLWDYIRENFRECFRSDGFVFCVHQGRVVVPLNVVTVNSVASVPGASTDRATLLDFCLVSPARPIAAIEMVRRRPDARVVLDSANTQPSMGGIDSTGRSLGPPVPTAWPLRGNGLIHLLLKVEHSGMTFEPADTLIYLKDAQGEVLGELMIGG